MPTREVFQTINCLFELGETSDLSKIVRKLAHYCDMHVRHNMNIKCNNTLGT